MKLLVVVDVQPMYENFIHFDIGRFCEFLSKYRAILYLFNGPDTVGEDSAQDIIRWLLDYGLDEELITEIEFEDKGYAFFRPWMDSGVEDETIIKVGKYMAKKDIHDSRDLPEGFFDQFEDLQDVHTQDSIYFPDLDPKQLKRFNSADIVGGGRTECLAETLLLMRVFNIKVKPINRFIYG